MMGLSLFDECIKVVLKNEKGFQNNPNDPGNWIGGFHVGRLVGTKYGITAKFFPDVDIKNLTPERAKQIYFNHYWKPMELEGINNPEIVLQIFDFGVNIGKRLAIKKAQRLAEVDDDGICGAETTHAINQYCGNFLSTYKHVRRIYYEWLAEKYSYQREFFEGRLKRVEKTKLFR